MEKGFHSGKPWWFGFPVFTAHRARSFTLMPENASLFSPNMVGTLATKSVRVFLMMARM